MNTHAKRKIRYIDSALQNRLLAAFILLEVLLTGGGMLVLYLDLKGVIEANLFRIHFAASEPLSALLLRDAMKILAALVLFNVAALGLAEWLWSRHLNTFLRPLSSLLIRTGKLDFTKDDIPEQRHVVLAHALAWRAAERERCQTIRAEIARLEENSSLSSAESVKQTRSLLEKLKASL